MNLSFKVSDCFCGKTLTQQKFPDMRSFLYSYGSNTCKTNWLKADWDHKKKSHILWSTEKALNPKKPTTPTNTTITHNNKTAHADTQKANTLNKYFKSTTKHSSNPTHRVTNKLTKSLTSTPITITESDTILAIKQSKNNNSSGPDIINIKNLKHLGPIAIKHLTNLYRITINTNTTPNMENLQDHPHHQAQKKPFSFLLIQTNSPTLSHSKN